jgi:hypothetical protein
MSLELLQSLSLPGDPAKPNEDSFAHKDGAAAVIDGATMLGEGLMPGGSDAAWIAQFGARRLMAHLGESEGARKALRATLADTQKSFEALRRHPPAETWQTPCASLMLAVQNEAGVEFLWFGDCAALVKQGDAAVTALQELRRAQPNISLAWIGANMPIRHDADREHYLDGFRRAGLD